MFERHAVHAVDKQKKRVLVSLKASFNTTDLPNHLNQNRPQLTTLLSTLPHKQQTATQRLPNASPTSIETFPV